MVTQRRRSAHHSAAGGSAGGQAGHGEGATHNVPISIITRAPSVLKQISSWHWQNGLLPAPSAPLEPMDAFRNQFLNTFSSETAAQDASDQGSNATRTAAVSGTSRR
jgi:hypothetical protein